MSGRAKVSIIVPAYNASDTIDDCIRSIVGQTYGNTEIIVVDDGSKDDTAIIAKRYPQVRVIEMNNSGVSAARNRGIKEATGKYIMFCDADDEYRVDMVEKMVDTITANNVDAVKCAIVENNGNGESVESLRQLADVSISTSDREQMRDVYSLFFEKKSKIKCLVMTLIINKKLIIDKKLFFNEKLAMMEDVEYYARLFAACKNILFMSTPLYHYRNNPNSVTRSKEYYQRNIDGVVESNKAISKILNNNFSVNEKHFKIAFYYIAKYYDSFKDMPNLSSFKQLSVKTSFKDEKVWKYIKEQVETKERIPTIMIKLYLAKCSK